MSYETRFGIGFSGFKPVYWYVQTNFSMWERLKLVATLHLITAYRGYEIRAEPVIERKITGQVLFAGNLTVDGLMSGDVGV